MYQNMYRGYYVVGGIVFVGVALFFLYSGSTPVTNYPSEGTTVVAFGDSLVEGVGATQKGGFVTLLSQKLTAEKGSDIINLGMAGDTTESALARIDTVLATNPRVVIVLVGGNDYLRRTPQETTRKNLATIIEKIQSRGSVVILLGVRGGILKDNFSDMYESLSEEYGTAYVSDVLEGLMGKKEFMSDTTHPNDSGYARIAGRVYPVLLDVF